MKKTSFVMTLAVALPLVVHAQFKSQNTSLFKPSELVQRPRGILSSLLNSSKFSMTHSYSLSFLSSGGQALNQGMYLNTMRYRFSDPLLAQVQIGYLHQPLGAWGNNAGSNGTLFLRSATLKYQPSDNFTFRVDYQSMPANSFGTDSPFGLR